MQGYLLDTDICIYIIKKRPPQVYARFRLLLPGSVGISSITLAELRYGVEKSARPTQNTLALNQFLLPLAVYEFDDRAAEEYGTVRATLERAGNPIGPLDTLIAALGLTLVTNNEREFLRVNDLVVENWTK